MNGARKTYALTGRSQSLDPRIHAFRGDLADVSLANRLFAAHFAAPKTMACRASSASIHATPGGDQSSELLLGEGFAVLDIAGVWAWGWSIHDHYVGYVRADTLGASSPADPGAKASDDPIGYARQFLDMVYVWGGRGGAGIDCSGLVQRAFASIGISGPRDSDMQRDHFGVAVDQDARQKGDLIFFPGHVGLLSDNDILLHATRHHGKVVEEPLADVVSRMIAKHGQGIVAVKRVARDA
jgi:cell wall-associated NlpC family hydrolase